MSKRKTIMLDLEDTDKVENNIVALEYAIKVLPIGYTNALMDTLNIIKAIKDTDINSVIPKCPAPVPCEDVMKDRGCGRVPKCFSHYGS